MCAVTRRPCGSPAASQSRRVSAMPPSETSHIATLQASAASWRTSSRPIPEPPPVTTAILPAKSFMYRLRRIWLQIRRNGGVPSGLWSGPLRRLDEIGKLALQEVRLVTRDGIGPVGDLAVDLFRFCLSRAGP